MIGGRFEVLDVMEWQDIVITPTQNTKERGYGYNTSELEQADNRIVGYRQLWSSFYEEEDKLFEKVCILDTPRYYKIPDTEFIFDNALMKKRYAISFDTLLLEANVRGAVAEKQVYLHVVGFGLGVWRVVQHQYKIFLETFGQRLLTLAPRITHIDVVQFSHFKENACGALYDGAVLTAETHPNGGIKILINNRNPAQKLVKFC